MKKVLFALVVLASFSCVAGEQKVASKDAIDAAVSLCKGYATEDGVSSDELASYLLSCVNDELEQQGYQAVAKID